MTSRRKFLQTTATGVGVSMLPILFTKTAIAQTVGNMDQTTWAGASDAAIATNAWNNRFTNNLPWLLDPTPAVIKDVLNADASGNVPVLNKRLKSTLPAAGFIYLPDAGHPNTYSIKTGQTVWPMLGRLGTHFPDGSPAPVTKVWGYGNTDLESIFTDGTGLPVTHLGRTLVVQRGTPITVNWYNKLVNSSNQPLPHIMPVDQTLAMQKDPKGAPINGVPITIHHHGAASNFEFDGGPDQWFTPLRKQVGPGVYIGGSNPNSTTGSDHLTYRYDSTEEACMHWYHDHAEGLTAVNAYAGLAGLYVIRDKNEAALINSRLIPSGAQEVPLVFQDKLFTANGSLGFTDDSPAFNGWNTLAPGSVLTLPGFPTDYDPNNPDTVVTGTVPTRQPEMFGDIIIVNGVAWPKLVVEPRQYRFRLLNASDSRVYNFSFGGKTVYQIATDGGFLNAPAALTSVVIAPGERKDIVVDFTGMPLGTRLVVTNDANFPYPDGDPTNPTDPYATIMQFKVGAPVSSAVSHMTPTTRLRGYDAATPLLPVVSSVPSRGIAATRKIMLGEGCDEYGRIMPMLGTVAEGTKRFQDPADIFPAVGTTEVWEFWNTTGDAHPVHMHLVQFRIINRQPFNGAIEEKLLSNGWDGVKLSAPPTLDAGPAVPAPADEQGWKDTVVCPPGLVTRVMANFSKRGKYVYHCHILSHEEHDMMRWYQVI